MDYFSDKKEIVTDKILSNLDKFVVEFTSLLDKKYVVVLGYVSILFGRTRATEDVDLLIPYLDRESFEKLWEKINDSDFWCAINLPLDT
ncbi:MAG: hypothetical protein ACE5ES_04960 [Candidatus Nanoarchaeia archaeon]